MEDNFIKNEYAGPFCIDKLWVQLREDLDSKCTILMSKFTVSSNYKLNGETGEKIIDPTMYHGSIGTVWAFQKYVLLLRKEAKDAE